jgi:hypothetical protein
VITNKIIAASRGGSSVSDWSSGMNVHEGELTSKVVEVGLSHPLRLEEGKGVEGYGKWGEGDSSDPTGIHNIVSNSRRSRKSCQNQNPDAIGGTKVPHDRDNTFAPLPRKAHVSVHLAELEPFSRAGSSESELGKAFIGSLTAN